MNDNLSFCITLSTFAASIISSVYSMLENLPKDVLISLLLFSYAAFLIAQVFRYKTKGRLLSKRTHTKTRRIAALERE